MLKKYYRIINISTEEKITVKSSKLGMNNKRSRVLSLQDLLVCGDQILPAPVDIGLGPLDSHCGWLVQTMGDQGRYERHDNATGPILGSWLFGNRDLCHSQVSGLIFRADCSLDSRIVPASVRRKGWWCSFSTKCS